MTKKKRGVKTCPKCNTETGPRTLICPNKDCNHQFTVKSKKFKKNVRVKVTDHIHELTEGDTLKISGGSQYIDKDGNIHSMGERGIVKYIKHSPDKQTLICQRLKDGREEGYVIIYVGPEKTSSYSENYKLKPHNIWKIIRRKPSEGNG